MRQTLLGKKSTVIDVVNVLSDRKSSFITKRMRGTFYLYAGIPAVAYMGLWDAGEKLKTGSLIRWDLHLHLEDIAGGSWGQDLFYGWRVLGGGYKKTSR